MLTVTPGIVRLPFHLPISISLCVLRQLFRPIVPFLTRDAELTESVRQELTEVEERLRAAPSPASALPAAVG